VGRVNTAASWCDSASNMTIRARAVGAIRPRSPIATAPSHYNSRTIVPGYLRTYLSGVLDVMHVTDERPYNPPIGFPKIGRQLGSQVLEYAARSNSGVVDIGVGSRAASGSYGRGTARIARKPVGCSVWRRYASGSRVAASGMGVCSRRRLIRKPRLV